ncbi:hypothetical protein ORI98_15165 [Shewanella sp. ULN5]|uniref:hypothetical protein n=1 Tax=Shewanella sp. ULN5 TaxID=2994678 RepID=UPI00273D0E98|nr:hypothetical protein [Shewanella sp. ULN5]MDP5147780.1 hypothetical protein [Shewanella sp. ULN5]
MGGFLRDEIVSNLSIDEEALTLISDEMLMRANAINQLLPEAGKNHDQQQIVTFIIRFDNKGYRLYHIDDVLRHYRVAQAVERIIITMESTESIRSNRQFGTHLEVRFDINDTRNCSLAVSSENSDWVESTYSTISELINKLKNKNGFIRNGWTPFTVQISGVVAGFILSLWAAMKITPHLTVESAFVVSFLFAFLVFSNIWTYLSQQILNGIGYFFPNIRFERKGKEKLHWLIQTVIGGLVVAIALYVINLLFGYVGSVLGEFIAK